MVSLNQLNPFSKREDHSNGSLMAFKVFTFVSWLLVHITNIHYAWNAPDGKNARTIWGQNANHPSPFSLNPAIVDIYWVILLFLQIGYMYHLWAGDHVALAANLGSHFIVNNLLMFGFVMLWVRARFWIAELLLIINLFNLLSLYFRHKSNPLTIHLPVVSGPLAWTYVAIFWCGAAAVNATDLPSRIVANVFIWSFMFFGLFFVVFFRDASMGFSMSVLTASLGVHQFITVKIVALQWIFAFTIMAVLFVASLAVAVPNLFNGGNQQSSDDRERQPLLNGD